LNTTQGQAISIKLEGRDPDGDAITFVVESIPSHGTLAGTAPSLSYIPSAEYRGWDNFRFKVSDGFEESNIARIEIRVDQAAGGPAEPPQQPDAPGDSTSDTPEAVADPPIPDSSGRTDSPVSPVDPPTDGVPDDEEPAASDSPLDSGPDTIPPKMIFPAEALLFDTSSEEGALVTYNIAAIDDRDGEVNPECSPASGYTFPVGRVNVVCRATDSSGNSAVGSFVVEVRLVDSSNDQFRLADYTAPIVASLIVGIAGVVAYAGMRAKRRAGASNPQPEATAES
jgi:hypothetical protein